MGNRRKLPLLLLLVLVSVLHVAHSNGTNDSAHMQDKTKKHSIVIRRSSGGGGGGGGGVGGGRGGGGGGGSSTAGGRGGSTDNNGGGGSDSNPGVPGSTVPLIAGAGVNNRNHGRHNAASSRFSFSLPVTTVATLLGAVLLANI